MWPPWTAKSHPWTQEVGVGTRGQAGAAREGAVRTAWPLGRSNDFQKCLRRPRVTANALDVPEPRAENGEMVILVLCVFHRNFHK